MCAAPPPPRAVAALQKLLLNALLIGAMTVLPGVASAIDNLQLTLGDLSGNGWQAQNVRLELHLDGKARLEIEQLTLPPPVGVITGLSLQCPQLAFTSTQLRCPRGELKTAQSPFGHGSMPVSFRYDSDGNTLDLSIAQAAFADGHLSLTLALQNDRWQLQLEGRAMDAATLMRTIPQLSLASDTRLTAKLDLNASIKGAGNEVLHVQTKLQSAGAGFASGDGRDAGENLAVQVELDAAVAGRDWQVRGTAAAARGTVCFGACWDLPQQPVTLQYQARWHSQENVIELSQFRFQDAGVVDASGTLAYALRAQQPWHRFDITLSSADSGRLYTRYAKPLLIGTQFEDMHVTGKISAHVRQPDGGAMSVQSKMQQLSLQDGKGRFGLAGVDGELAWSAAGDAEQSDLRWQSGNLYRIPIGAARLRLQIGADDLQLAQAASIPVFDGSLEVARLSLAHPGGADMRGTLDAVLTPLAMQDFSRAVGWPEMAGRLSGVVPELNYAGGRLSVNGVLLIHAFDGNITIRNLRVDNLLGVVPSLNADIQMRAIDLQQLTGTFSFGRIDGRLEGSVAGLNLQNWRPVAFDARFATPEDDDSRHRISQRAVDNLTSLGGGVGGALSRSFLRVFDDFSYDRLGLSCKLENGVCEMGGIAPANDGYYIVKGGGLPRIDVIGYQRRVNWPVLVKRLEAVTSGSGPVIR